MTLSTPQKTLALGLATLFLAVPVVRADEKAAPPSQERQAMRERLRRVAVRLVPDVRNPAVRKEMEKSAKEFGRGAGEFSSDVLAETGETLFLLSLLSVIGVLSEYRNQAFIHGQPTHFVEGLRLAGYAARKVVDSGDTYTSIAGGGAAGVVFQLASPLFRGIVQNSVARKVFMKMLSSAATSTVIFIGWELGAQLWEEARYLLVLDPECETSDVARKRCEEEYTRAEGVISLLRKPGGGKFPGPEDLGPALFAKMRGNIGKILLYDKKLRERWIYNAFRLNILTGDFVTLVLAMSQAGLLGAKIGEAFEPVLAVHPYARWIPSPLRKHAGGILGFLFGMGGGLVDMNIHQVEKDRLTLGFRASELAVETAALSRGLTALEGVTSDAWPGTGARVLNQILPGTLYPDTLDGALSLLRRERERILDTFLSTYMLAKGRVDGLERENLIAGATMEHIRLALAGNTAEKQALEETMGRKVDASLLWRLPRRIERNRHDIDELYLPLISYLEERIPRLYDPYLSNLTRKWQQLLSSERKNLLPGVEREMDDVSTLDLALEEMTEILGEMKGFVIPDAGKETDETYQKMTNFLDSFSRLGYREEDFLERLRKAGS